MYQSVTDPFEKATDYRGFNADFAKKVRAARRVQAAELLRLQEITMAKQTARRRGMPQWAVAITLECAERHRVSPTMMMSNTHRYPVVAARNDAIYRVKDRKPELSCVLMGKWFNRDHTSIIYSLARHQRRHNLPAHTTYDLDGANERSREFHRRRRQSGDTRE